MPTHTSLRALEALVRRGSIQLAATDLCVSAGAVSQQIRVLEDDLGMRLFDRNGRRMRPTDRATALAMELRGAFDRIDAAVNDARGTTMHSTLRIATLPSIANRILLPRLSDAKAVLGDVQLKFTYIHRQGDYLNADADVAISVADSAGQANNDLIPFLNGEVRPYASPSYVAQMGGLDDPSALANATLLHDFTTSTWESWFQLNGMIPNSNRHGDIFEDFELLTHAAIANQGVALCPCSLVKREIEAGSLVRLSEIAALPDRNYVISIRNKLSAVAPVFRDWLCTVTRGG